MRPLILLLLLALVGCGCQGDPVVPRSYQKAEPAPVQPEVECKDGT